MTDPNHQTLSLRKFFGYLVISKPPGQRTVLGFLLCSELPGAAFEGQTKFLALNLKHFEVNKF